MVSIDKLYEDYSLNKNFLVTWLVVFYGISTLVGYLKPNPVNFYKLDC